MEQKREKEQELQKEKELEEKRMKESASSALGCNKLDYNTSDNGTLYRNPQSRLEKGTGILRRQDTNDDFYEDDVFVTKQRKDSTKKKAKRDENQEKKPDMARAACVVQGVFYRSE
jgi:hypothetical protein